MKSIVKHIFVVVNIDFATDQCIPEPTRTWWTITKSTEFLRIQQTPLIYVLISTRWWNKFYRFNFLRGCILFSSTSKHPLLQIIDVLLTTSDPHKELVNPLSTHIQLVHIIPTEALQIATTENY